MPLTRTQQDAYTVWRRRDSNKTMSQPFESVRWITEADGSAVRTNIHGSIRISHDGRITVLNMKGVHILDCNTPLRSSKSPG